MHNISNIFYFGSALCVFRTVFPSIVRSLRLYTQHQAYVIQVQPRQSAEPVWHMPDAVCTVSDSWRWTERPSETRRMLIQNKIYLRYCASSWFYYRNISRCTVLETSNMLHCSYSCYTCLSADEPSGSKLVHVEDILKIIMKFNKGAFCWSTLYDLT